jgi:hypothetical protein
MDTETKAGAVADDPYGSVLYWGRCKLGPRRVYWAVAFWGDRGLQADGYAATAAEAEAAAREAVGRLAGQYSKVSQGLAYQAAYWHKDKVAARRKARGGKPRSRRARGYLYTIHIPEVGSPCWYAHPVLKRTPKRVWVAPWTACRVEDLGTAREAESLERLSWDDNVVVLDRQKLERDGRAYSRRYSSSFHVRPE